MTLEGADLIADLGRFFIAFFLDQLLQVLAQALDVRRRPEDAGAAVGHFADVLAVAVDAAQERRGWRCCYGGFCREADFCWRLFAGVIWY